VGSHAKDAYVSGENAFFLEQKLKILLILITNAFFLHLHLQKK